MAKHRKRKAPNGTGSVYQTKSGQWKVAVTIPSLNGSSKRITRNAVSHRQGLMILDDLRAEFKNFDGNPESVTVTELADRYLVSFEGEQSSLDGYRNLLDKHIGPHIGERLIASLTPLEVQDWVQALRESKTGARTLIFTGQPKGNIDVRRNYAGCSGTKCCYLSAVQRLVVSRCLPDHAIAVLYVD